MTNVTCATINSRQSITHPTAMPQCFDAVSPACANNVNPTSETVGTIVNGVMIFSNLPTNPVTPMTNWNIADTAIAPDISRIRTCHNSVFSSALIDWICSGAGHFHCGKLNIAKTGTKKDIVPPYRMAYILDQYSRTHKIKDFVDENRQCKVCMYLNHW